MPFYHPSSDKSEYRRTSIIDDVRHRCHRNTTKDWNNLCQILEFVDFSPLKGEDTTDSLRSTESHYFLAHYMLAHADLDKDNALRRDNNRATVENNTDKGFVAIESIAYDRFVDDVLEDSSIYYDGTKFQHHPYTIVFPFTKYSMVLSSGMYET